MSDINTKIINLLEGKLAGTDCFIVDVRSTPAGRINVYVDCDSGLPIKTCAEISRFLEQHLDTDTSIPDNYLLEVSSPGLDQPLKINRQYKKNIGRVISVSLADGKVKEGTLLYADDEKIQIEEEIKNEKKKKEKVQTDIPFIEIKKTTVTVKF